MLHDKDRSSDLRNELIKAHKNIEGEKNTSGILDALILLFIWCITFILIEQILYLTPIVKSTSVVLLFTCLIWLFWKSKRSFSKQTFIEFYREFSKSSNTVELGYALDLQNDNIANPKLVEAAIFKNLDHVDPGLFRKQLDNYINDHHIIQASKKKKAFTFVALTLLLATGINFDQATSRYLSFYQTFDQPNPFSYSISPGNATLEQGNPFNVIVEFDPSLIPDEVVLYLKTPVEQEFRRRGMDGESTIFSSSIIELNSELSYFIEMDGFRTEQFDIELQLRPRLVDFDITIIAPQYANQDTSNYSYPFSQVQGLQGSELILSGTANKDLDEFLVKNTDFEQDALVNENLEFTYITTIQDPDTIQFILRDKNGLENLNPFRFTVQPVIDDFPIAEILEPASSYEDIEPSFIQILYQSSDDYGITKTRLSYELQRAFVNEPEKGIIEMNTNRSGVLQSFDWAIEALNLKPKDALSFWIEVTDNDNYNGFKTSRSNVITLTVPSLIDFFDEIDEQEEDVQSDLEDISESFEEMQEQYEMFREQLQEDPEVDYQDMRQLQEVQDRQEQIQQQIEELNEKFDELKEELSESNMLSEETLQAYDELKKLMEEIDDPAFREALEMMQQNLNSMTPEQLREAMQNAEFNEELYKERLERTLELFKQLKLNADLEKLAQSYEDIARQEEGTNTSESESNSKNEQQESLLEQTQQVEQQLEQLSENATSKTEETVSDLQEKSKEILEEIKKELERRLNELKNNANSENGGENQGEQQENQPNGDSKSEQQRPLGPQYNQLAEMTRSAMSQMNQQQLNVNIAGLQYILYSLINLSLEQEELNTYASATESRSQAYVGFARDQKNVENIFSSLSDSLYQISTEIPQFSNDINREKLEVERLIEQSLTQMTERNQSRSSVATRSALGGINKISFMIANLLEQLQNQSNSGSGSGGGMSMQQMIEQMQQMGQSQQQINQQIQDMINDIQGERLSQDQMDRLNQLSRQQNEIRKQLQEIQRNGGVEAGDKIGSELERMIEQMEETINDLRGGAVDPTLIERQQNILSRMLEAEDALQERDEEERREGAEANEVNRISPPEITLEELEQQIRNRLNDPNFTKYSPDYQRLIERYFELLKEIQNREIQ